MLYVLDFMLRFVIIPVVLFVAVIIFISGFHQAIFGNVMRPNMEELLKKSKDDQFYDQELDPEK